MNVCPPKGNIRQKIKNLEKRHQGTKLKYDN